MNNTVTASGEQDTEQTDGERKNYLTRGPFQPISQIADIKMGKDNSGEDGSVEVILPDGFGSSFNTKEIRAKVSHVFSVYQISTI